MPGHRAEGSGAHSGTPRHLLRRIPVAADIRQKQPGARVIPCVHQRQGRGVQARLAGRHRVAVHGQLQRVAVMAKAREGIRRFRVPVGLQQGHRIVADTQAKADETSSSARVRGSSRLMVMDIPPCFFRLMDRA